MYLCAFPLITYVLASTRNTIPVISDNNERLFSTIKDIITNRRNRLNKDIIKAC